MKCMLAVLVGVIGGSARCFDNAVKLRTDLPEVRILFGGWDSQVVSGYIAYILLKEKMGVSVKWFPADTVEGYWDYDKNYPYSYREWFEGGYIDIGYQFNGFHVDDSTTGPLVESGVLTKMLSGVVENIGIFVPDYVPKDHPGIRDFAFIRSNKELKSQFIEDNWPYTQSEKVTVWGSVPGYQLTKYTAKLLKTHRMNFTFNVTGSEFILGELVRKMYKDRKSFLMAHYTPSREFGDIPFSRVNFPMNTAGTTNDICRQKFYCDFSEESLLILQRVTLEDIYPEVVEFNRQFFIDRNIVNEIISKKYENGTISWEEATCAWLKANSAVWESWIVTLLEPPVQRLTWLHFFSIFVATTIIWVGIYQTWGCWRPNPAMWDDPNQKKPSNLECITTSWSIVIEVFDFCSEILVSIRVSQDPSLDVWYTVVSLGILTVAISFDLFLIYRRCCLLSEVRTDSVVPVGWLGREGDLSRQAKRGYENQLLTIYTTFIEDIPSVTLTSFLIWKNHRDDIMLLSCAVSIFVLGQKLAAIEKLFMWKSIGMGRHRIDEDKGRRVREKSLNDFLSSVEQDENNLRKLTVSCALRRDSQPELMMSLDWKAYDENPRCDEYNQQDKLTNPAFYSPKNPLEFGRTKKSPAWRAASEAFASPLIASESVQSSPPSAELSNKEFSNQLNKSVVRRNSFYFRSTPGIRNTNFLHQDRRKSLHVSAINPTRLFPPGRHNPCQIDKFTNVKRKQK